MRSISVLREALEESGPNGDEAIGLCEGGLVGLMIGSDSNEVGMERKVPSGGADDVQSFASSWSF